ncbi:MAG: ribonuclease HII [Candidatus Aenigmarchaeota archaeon]|nr:ribonuclease HII [Candidatus Aenigmarchaeota archaeon]
MVVAGVVIDENDEQFLKKIGVKDSKKLTPKKREELAIEIEKIAKSVFVLRVPACKIDTYRSEGINLDKIEAMKMAEIITMCEAGKVFVDSLGANSHKFHSKILELVPDNQSELIVENYADETYPVVSAASIMAKVERDLAVKELKEKVGFDFGVGYSHDRRTIEFIEKLLKKSKELPPYVRESWVTTQVLRENSFQKKLKNFFGKKKDCKEGENEN